MPQVKKCPHCGRMAIVRGVCKTRYADLFKAVKAGLLTWPEAEEQGLCSPAESKLARSQRMHRTLVGRKPK